MTIQVLNGPNLGRLGLREPEKYGTDTYAELVELVEATGRELGVEVQVRQTDDEAEMLRWIHAASDAGDAGADQSRRAGRTRRSRCATPSPRSTPRWWRCTSPTSTPARSSGTTPTSRGSPTASSPASGVSGYILALGWLAQQGVK